MKWSKEIYFISAVASRDLQVLLLWLFIDEDILVKELLTQAWTNFAKYGDPSPPGAGQHWPPVSRIESERDKWYFNISGHQASDMDGSLDSFSRLRFWDNLLLK